MTREATGRWLRVVVALAAAVAIATWAARRERPRTPTPAATSPTVQPAGPAPSEAARRICAERLAKLGKALRLYAADHGGAFPAAPTPGDSDTFLPPRLKRHGVTAADCRCPTAEGPNGHPYLYQCYRERGSAPWPNWMPAKHAVTTHSPPETWLMSDYLSKDLPGPHSQTEKAFNYLRADGSVKFHTGRPRAVYR